MSGRPTPRPAAASGIRAVNPDALAGTGTLVRFIVRRDRLLIAAWTAVAVALPLFNAYSLTALLPTHDTRALFAEATAANPLTAALLGPLPDTSIEGIVVWRSGVQSLIVVGLAALLFAIRHTRADEDAGRRELMAGGAVGRHTLVTAVVIVAAAVNLAVAVLVAAALALGAGYALGGSLLFGLTVAACGTMFAAGGLVAAQLAQSAALARSGAVALLVAGVLPGIAVPDDKMWIFPAGWLRVLRPYAGAQWWLPLVPLAVTAALVLAAYAVSARRDLGAGLLPDRGGSTGPVRAGRRLGSVGGLAWRLHGGQVVTWALTLTTMSVAVGWVSASFDARFGSLDAARELLGRLGHETMGDALLTIFTYVFCLVVACPTVMSALRPYAEESRGRAAPLLASPTGRIRWLSGHVAFGLAAPAVLLPAIGLGTGLGYGLATGRAEAILAQTGTALLFAPATWTFAGVAIAVYGLRPRLAVPAAWASVLISAGCVALWEARTIGRTAFLLTPFGYGHPEVSPEVAAPVAYALLAALLLAVGGAAFARRDLLT
ncbi:ABC transporter permease [Nonomuraea sp. SYSU D8015]|uniref:ABC transporter permease n=1 Tax=Nonomuraea sp. SYSU D8015 TaxID=2593644 RepID=UPI0016612AD0|nr:ABC transporter permease [Nonomuraea sp. SYSU D8015]